MTPGLDSHADEEREGRNGGHYFPHAHGHGHGLHSGPGEQAGAARTAAMDRGAIRAAPLKSIGAASSSSSSWSSSVDPGTEREPGRDHRECMYEMK